MLTVQFLVTPENGLVISVPCIKAPAFGVLCMFSLGAEVNTAWLRLLTSPATSQKAQFILMNGRNCLDLCNPTSKSASVWSPVVAWESHRESTVQIGTICSQILKTSLPPPPPPHTLANVIFVQVRLRSSYSSSVFFAVACERFSALSSLYLLFSIRQIYQEDQLKLREDPLT